MIVTAIGRIGCELGQGYFFSEPQPPTIIGSLLHRQYGDGGEVDEELRVPAPLSTPTDTAEEPAAVVLPKLRKTTPAAQD